MPALLVKWDRSEFLANGAALSAARIGCDVQGVECERGVPTGRLTPAAAARVRAAMPPKDFEQRLAEARAAEVQPHHAIDDMRWMEQRIGPRSGTLTPGLLADIVVLSDDPLAASPPQLRDIRPMLVVVGGRVLLERPAR